MSWSAHHQKSELYAINAGLAHKNGNLDRATELYRMAAESEALALNFIEPAKARTFGITAVSTAALWFKAGAFDRSIELAQRCLKNHNLPPFTIAQLQELLAASQKACANSIAV